MILQKHLWYFKGIFGDFKGINGIADIEGVMKALCVKYVSVGN